MQSKSIITQASRRCHLLLLHCNSLPHLLPDSFPQAQTQITSSREKSRFIFLHHCCIKKQWRGKSEDKHQEQGSQDSSFQKKRMAGSVPVWRRVRHWKVCSQDDFSTNTDISWLVEWFLEVSLCSSQQKVIYNQHWGTRVCGLTRSPARAGHMRSLHSPPPMPWSWPRCYSSTSDSG